MSSKLDMFSTPLITAKIHGTPKPCKSLELTEKWFNTSKKGFGYYFILERGDTSIFISVDSKTANGKYWLDAIGMEQGGNKKVSCKGYVYVNSRGYLAYAVKNVSNFKCYASTTPKADVHFDNERKYSKDDYDDLYTDIDDVFFD